MARKASAANIVSSGDPDESAMHGGELGVARRLFPDAPEPFIDLSTGINPVPYPLSPFPADVFTRLPEPGAARALASIVARAYGAPSAAHVALAPGTQILLPLVAGLVRPGHAAILGPTYSEFARAAALAGHQVTEVSAFADLADADLAFVANPNNPDGRLSAKNELLSLGERMRLRGGLLVVDEAFMDAGPGGASLAPDVSRGNIVVLRSFGKFFGLAGLRLGFALTPPRMAMRITALLGPWAVSGPALAAGAQALADTAWIENTRRRLAQAANRLDGILSAAGLEIIGGTMLFRLTRTPAADALFHHLGRAGILVRIFADKPDWLRFGLPADEEAWQRLQIAMAAFRRDG
jgi:cobalamin biosynthesis protein CobC